MPRKLACQALFSSIMGLAHSTARNRNAVTAVAGTVPCIARMAASTTVREEVTDVRMNMSAELLREMPVLRIDRFQNAVASRRRTSPIDCSASRVLSVVMPWMESMY